MEWLRKLFALHLATVQTEQAGYLIWGRVTT